MTRLAGYLWLLAAVFVCCACSPRYLIIQGVASEVANQRTDAEADLVLAREASAFYLKLSESLLNEAPTNAKL
ncbi:MAG: TRAP transporter TatT component family protein, partial [Rhodoferax sp.]